ncbi:MAG: hypothetical protein LBI28_02335 [Treponema sp.]|jgi:hypothetical protein|nr:hypothetical protein [Treponema sp.]
MIYEKCRDILLQEFELVQTAVAVQEKIRLAVTERQWTTFEDNLSAMNGIESKLEDLEIERDHLFSVFKTLIHQQSFTDNLDAKGRFYELVSILPENQRNDLTSIYRSLKLESIKLRMANDDLMSYLLGIKAVLKDFFDLAFPERAGKMYTKAGTHFSDDMRSMVLNRSF